MKIYKYLSTMNQSTKKLSKREKMAEKAKEKGLKKK